jgi:hypothetical protein
MHSLKCCKSSALSFYLFITRYLAYLCFYTFSPRKELSPTMSKKLRIVLLGTILLGALLTFVVLNLSSSQTFAASAQENLANPADAGTAASLGNADGKDSCDGRPRDRSDQYADPDLKQIYNDAWWNAWFAEGCR